MIVGSPSAVDLVLAAHGVVVPPVEVHLAEGVLPHEGAVADLGRVVVLHF